MPRTGRPPLPFDTAYVVNERGCWIWQRGRSSGGYGHYRGQRAHRFSYALAKGPIPPGMEVCHKCDTPPCINPDHLYLGTHKQNMLDASKNKLFANQRKTHCPSGHEYSPENTVRHGRKRIRRCLTCERERQRRINEAEARERRERGLRDNKNKTHCKRGHEFTPENTYLWRNHRVCRACQAARRAAK